MLTFSAGVTPVNQSIQFSNMTLIDTVTVTTEDDDVVTGNRSFTVILSSSDSLVEIVNGTANVNIIENGKRVLTLFVVVTSLM